MEGLRSDCFGAITDTIFREFFCLDDGGNEGEKADRAPFVLLRKAEELEAMAVEEAIRRSRGHTQMFEFAFEFEVFRGEREREREYVEGEDLCLFLGKMEAVARICNSEQSPVWSGPTWFDFVLNG